MSKLIFIVAHTMLKNLAKIVGKRKRLVERKHSSLFLYALDTTERNVEL